jgi:hypothetical protein
MCVVCVCECVSLCVCNANLEAHATALIPISRNKQQSKLGGGGEVADSWEIKRTAIVEKKKALRTMVVS